MLTIIAANTMNLGRRSDRQVLDIVVESTIRGLERLAEHLLRAVSVPVGGGSTSVGVVAATTRGRQHGITAMNCWRAGLGSYLPLGMLPAGSVGRPAGFGKPFAS